MSTYSYTYKKLHDIEWFFQWERWAIHAVSNAGYIPMKIDRDKNIQVQYDMEEMGNVIESRNDIYINEDYVRYRLELQNNRRDSAFEDYLHGFVRMALKGFCSYDRDITQRWDDRKYVLIAAPLRFIEPRIELTELIRGEDVNFWREPIVYNDKVFENWCFR